MRIAVEFPSVVYREGPEKVAELAKALEHIGYDQIDMFDHVVMAHEAPGRPVRYPPNSPMLEALTTLGFLAAVTRDIGLGTEVLVLPQRQAALVAKQVANLDLLTGGRIRLGVGVGWQESEYDALGRDFRRRGRVMDESIDLLRSCWHDESIDFEGEHEKLVAMALEPKPPQGADLPIWIGGISDKALRRVAKRGDGWLAMGVTDRDQGKEMIATIKQYAEEESRDWGTLGFQAAISPPPRPGEASDKNFYGDPEAVADVAATLKEAGFGWVTMNATGVFLAGARAVDQLIEAFDELHQVVRRKVGYG